MPSDKSLPVYDALQTLIPELKESEDEKMVVKIARTLSFAAAHNLITDYDELIAMQNWLEKQKKLFESGRGLYYYDGEKTTYCGYPATEENPYDFAMSQQEKQKENKFAPRVLPCSAAWFEDGDEKQKEPHYTKRNALFDKCVENCDPEVMKRVSDEVDEMLEKEQKPAEINEYEIIKKHITDDSLSSEVNKRLKECGWYVTDEKPAEWSEEDNAMLKVAIAVLRRYSHDDVANFLKSLRPSWKPSEEQMEALKCAVEDVAKFSKREGRQVELENEPYYSALHSLYCNLEKLI